MKIDKDHSNLIQSLRKLIKQGQSQERFASNGSDCQREIFGSFNRSDFQKIIQNFEDDNPALRQLSFKLMSLLLSKNEENKLEFCKIFEIFPTRGKVVLNKLPTKLVNAFPDMATLLTKLRQSNPTMDKQVYLSSYNQTIMTLDHSNYPEDSFLDPQNSVIIILVEEEKQSPRKATFFGNHEEVSTPKKKTAKNIKEDHAQADVVNTSAGRGSPLESILAYSSRTRPRC